MRRAAIATFVVGLTALSTAHGFAQTCPPLPSLSAIPRSPSPAFDLWLPSATQAPLVLVTPDPVST